MSTGDQKKSYADKIERVRNYIQANLDEDLNIDSLCKVANFSRYHFHRLFSTYSGVSVARFVVLERLKRASYRLCFRKQYSITDIALDARFENPESFSRAFKAQFGQTPSQFRRNPDWESWEQKYLFHSTNDNNTKRELCMNIQIVEFPEIKIAVLEHRGSASLLNNSVSRFIEWRKTSGLSPVNSSQTFGLVYDDPKTTEPESFRFDICGSVAQKVPDNPQDVINKTIPVGRCATFRHHGPHELLDEKVRYLYAEWLHSSDESLRDFPCFFEYQNLFPDVSEQDLVTDVYLPLQ